MLCVYPLAYTLNYLLNYFSFPSLAIDALREADPTRKCYRLIGGVLVERTVQEVLPALESNKEQVIGHSAPFL